MPSFGAVLSNIGVPLANTVAANNFAQTAERDKQRAQAMQDVIMQRQADQADQQRRVAQSTINLNAAHAKSLDEGVWGTAFPGVDETGNPVLVQQHKQTGELRVAKIGGGAAPSIAPPPVGVTPPVVKGAPAGFVPPNVRQPSGVASLAGVRDSQDMAGADDTSAPTSPPQAALGASPQSSGVLRPYIKPSPSANDRTPHNFSVDGVGMAGSVDKQGRYYDNSGAMIPPGAKITPFTPPVQPNFSPLVTTGPGGVQVVQPFDTKHGTAGAPIADAKQSGAAATGGAQMASKAGQFGEMLKKSSDLFKASEALDVGLGQSAANDIAQHGLGIGGFRVPGTQGLGSLMLNRTPQYATYQAALDPFVLANAHAMSGARINPEQAAMIKNSIERKPGDLGNPMVTKQKEKNIIDQMNSVAASLPPEIVAAQEAQMDPAELEKLRSMGYKGAATPRGGGRGGAPPGVDPGANTRTGSGKSPSVGSPVVAAPGTPSATGPVNLATKPDLATRVQQLKSAGISKQAAVVQLQHEGYDLSKPPTEE